ncbi:HAD-IA family hydrolase [Streptomyces sp. LX-29]|uniref:HAD family hydrolase n=1 Tax=Streptomyces sp. LX-29 TaxID=2900152 RepID=UPI00240D4CAB|nr:HAD-IA family hydrolase [Streptomyces sp. LX-29]WFB05956.1 HAD-IA family hydrolase [Streptomyces sp. LX-29]
MAKGVLFDFSGTLFHIEPAREWLRAAAEEAGRVLTEEELTAYAERLEAVGAQPGGVPPRRLPAELAELWRERDMSAGRHRAVYTALARSAMPPAPAASAPVPDLTEALYERHRRPAAWRPYPDTASTLTALRGRGVPVAVVSNIGWDPRPVFRAHGVYHLVESYVLSYEHGVAKPDPALFQAACDRLGLPPHEVVMVGDSAPADGGAAALGCAVHLVDGVQVDRRPDALAAVLDLV